MKRAGRFAAVIVLIVMLMTLLREFPRDAGDLRTNLWAPARLLLSHRDPYDLDNLATLSEEEGVTIHRSVWFPTVIGLFLPLGALPFPMAADLWLITNIGLLCACIAISLRGRSTSWVHRMMLGIAVLVFPPLIAQLRMGQVSLLVLFSLLYSTQLIQQERLLLTGLIFSLSLVKPHLILLAAPALAFYLVTRDDWQKALIGFVAGLAIQTAPLFFTFPSWLLSYFGSLTEAPQWIYPSILTIARIWLGHEGLAWGACLLVFVFALVITIRLWKHETPAVAMVWTLAVTLIVSPFVWSWDQILLLPLIVSLAISLTGREALLWWTGYAATIMGFIYLRLGTSNVDYLYFWVPWVMVGLAVGILRHEGRLDPRAGGVGEGA